MAEEEQVRVGLLRPLVLVGTMGAGKTSVGRRLARLLDAQFRDSDLEIEAAAGMNITEIFATMGEPSFRSGERRVIERLLDEGPAVIATGGGAFIDPGTRALIRRDATSVWLRADLETLWERVRDRPGRPLLDRPDPKAALAEIDNARRPVYAEADVIVDSPPRVSHQAMAQAILSAVAARDAEGGSRPTLGAVR